MHTHHVSCFCFCFVFFAALGIEPRASHVVRKCFTIELYSWPYNIFPSTDCCSLILATVNSASVHVNV